MLLGLSEGCKQQDPSCLKPHSLCAVLVQHDMGYRDREGFMFKISLHQSLPLTLGQCNKNVMIYVSVKHERVATQFDHYLEDD